MSYNSIYIKGAKVHNLKNIELNIPHNKLVVITGLSGSGKSTLAFDTIFAEGQRRYVESLSSYARQFLGRMSKPEVDIITGIAPAIAIEQKVISRNPRSTVGTTTEIYDYLRLLFARIGKTISPISGMEVKCYTTDDVVNYLLGLGQGSRVAIAVPLQLKEGQGLIDRLLQLFSDGIQRLYIDGQITLLEEFIPTINASTTIDGIYVIVDRIKVASDDDTLNRMRESISGAFGYGTNSCVVIHEDKIVEFSALMNTDGIEFERPTEHLFGFNNPIGACPVCEGFGKVTGIDENLVVPDKSRSIFDNAIACWRGDSMSRYRDQLVKNAYKFDFPIHEPYHKLTEQQRRLLWTGNEYFEGLNAFFDYLERNKHHRRNQFGILKARYVGKTLCPVCNGARLKAEALYVKVGGKDIAQLANMTVDTLIDFFNSLTLDQTDSVTAQRILLEINNRLKYLSDVGLGYLTLDRASQSLSGGESQRINLSTSLGSNLTGSLYILDEPSIGLHPRDTQRLITVLKQLRDLGNTVIVVEHEEEIISAADFIVDMGPLAGENGGEVVYCGEYKNLCQQAINSLTADYLCGRKSINPPIATRSWSNYITINSARENNLKNITVKLPLGVITCITGVSGSGKSSLVKGILYPALSRIINGGGAMPGDCDGISGDISLIRGVELVDQNPISKSSRSNPVTYLKAYDHIRRLFAEQPYAQRTSIPAAHFSFNNSGGRCEQCLGEGTIKIGMQFMADVTLTCDACSGKRFKPEILDIKYRNKDINDILNMSVEEAVNFFSADDNRLCKNIVTSLTPLLQVGLGYLRLGQSSSTLSGGESQRIKLASFLSAQNHKSGMLFIFDEPTTGLHFHDIKLLLKAFNNLADNGHTVVIVEHNMDVIKCADHIIDLGPEAGDRGGEIVFEGKPTELLECKSSHTAHYLKQHIK